MKTNLLKVALFIFLTLSFIGITTGTAQAYWNGYYHGGYHRYNGYYNRPYYGYHCRWVGGFWSHGYWHAARRVCWNR